jgi:phosphate/sulfate permease
MCENSFRKNANHTDATLEMYVGRNLIQNKFIFWFSAIFITIGFGVILWGIFQAINNSLQTTIVLAATISGIVTEFIGATFMVVYRSTIEQANEYYKTLVRRDLVDLAIEVLNEIDNQATTEHLKSNAMANLAQNIIELSGKH